MKKRHEILKEILLKEGIDNGGISKFSDELQLFYLKCNGRAIKKEIPLAFEECFEIFKGFTDEEQSSIMSSAATSYYTPKIITNSIVNSICQTIMPRNNTELEILEPSVGEGAFIFPFLENSFPANFTLIEKDSLAFARLQKNIDRFDNIKYEKILNKSFETFNANGEYDIVIGNFPFGDRSLESNQHNYEIGKNIQNFCVENRYLNLFFPTILLQ